MTRRVSPAPPKDRASDGRLSYDDILRLCNDAIHKHPTFRSMQIDTLRYADASYERRLIQRARPIPHRPHVFIVAGFHGEEPAGPIAVARGIASWLALADAHHLNLSIIPCVNPWGYEHHARATPNTRYTNAGFAGRGRISPEFASIKNIIATQRVEFFLSLHEDDANAVGVFAHAFGDRNAARLVVSAMTSARIPLDPYPSSDDAGMEHHLIGHGLVFDHHDGSAEDQASRKPENILSLATEIASTPFPLRLRVLAHLRGVKAFLRLASK